MRTSSLIIILLAIVASVSAQVSIPVTALDSVKVSGSIAVSVAGNFSNPDLDPVLWGQRCVLNVTSVIGPVRTIIEVGTVQVDGNVKT